MPGPLEAVLEVVAVGVDMADLAAGPQLLAVEVHTELRVAGHRVRVAVVEPSHVLPRPAEDVDHHRPWRPWRRRAERQVEDGAQVVLELAGHRAVLAPVAG